MSLVVLTDGPADGVRVLTLNDPDRRNAMSPQLQADLVEAVDSIARDSTTRVLVVTGSGKAFSAGADLPAVFGEQDRDTVTVRAGLKRIYDSFLRLGRLEIPVIAAVNGAAVGAGLNLAMVCDVRYAAPGAKFGVTFTKLGLHPGGGCTWFLTQVLGRQRAFSLIMDGATFDAERAKEYGLVLEVVDDPLAVALEQAARWAEVDPALARDIKRATGIAENSGFEATVEFESWAQAASTRSPLLAEAIARFRK